MHLYIIISIFLTLEYAYNADLLTHQYTGNNSDCLTDELYGDFTVEEYNNLVKRRKNVRKLLKNNLYRKQQDTLSIKVVFHNVHKIVDANPQRSFCDYQGLGNDYSIENKASICNDRLDKALEILNEQFSPAQIKFIAHPQYPTMLEISDPLYEHITGTKIDSIKENYNIPHTLNIYLDYCLGEIDIENDECTSSVGGFSTYPKDKTNKELGIAIRHFGFPDMNDLGIFVLPHEIGHYFSLEHIEGNWFRANEHPAIEFVNGNDCIYRGDLICDTPGQPGNASKAFHHEIYNDERICIYHGYNGNYDPETSVLRIGGYENISLNSDLIPIPTDNTWCDETSGIVDELYGYPDHCWNHTNYDPTGAFFGTRDLPDSCLISDQVVYATKACHENLFQYLPIATNFLQQTILAQYCGRRGYHEYDPGEGFTPEQFANIRYSLEHDYTGCNVAEACNFDTTSTYLLRFDESNCNYPEENYDCEGNCTAVEDCLGECGGSAVDDECGVCNGPGAVYECGCTDIADSECDCAGNVDLGCGCGEPGALSYCIDTDSDSLGAGDSTSYCLADLPDGWVEDCSDPEPLSLFSSIIPEDFSIDRIYPNPFNPVTNIIYRLPEQVNVQIIIYDIFGKLVTTLIDDFQIAGYHYITWDASSYSSGIYFLNMSSGEISETKKMVLIK